ncbi:PKD-like domain-containing protein [Ferruginibacter sp. SUN002]|uniref:PKD-like domain-containing protein n=1 Tax=Ferruginibacter sp. SUN002 TaxID=2937789 RepID=UPI003D368A24
MNKLYLLILGLLFSLALFAQPANDECSFATTITPNGSCNAGTTVGANDSWSGTVGCQSGNNHRDVWYTFVSTGTTLTANITAGTLTGNIEFILVSGDCVSGFTLAGSVCGASPMSTTIYGLDPGVTYYYTISSSTNSQGTFTSCITTTTPPPSPGQDCSNAAILCNADPFSQAASNAGFGAQEVTTANSCWGIGGERQSKWFKFTAGCSGTLEFNITPINSSDDYDWSLWNITGNPTGCTTKGTSIACNWSGCSGSTGISSCPSSEPGRQNCGSATGGDPCGSGSKPRAWGNWSSPGGGASSCQSNTVNIVAGNTYALLVDNFVASNSGFSLTFGGACGGGTATIGPNADFTYAAATCGSYNFTKTCQTSNSTFLWQFGDGTTSTSQNPSHTYTASAVYTITLQVTDALGCIATFSETVNITATAEPLVTSPVNYCQNDVASTLTATGSNLLWYTAPTGGTGSSTAPTPSTATAGTISYYVTQTILGCESPRAKIDIVVAAASTSNTSLSICPSALPYTWNSLTFNAAGSQTAHFTNSVGCDSAATLTLTVKANTTSNTSLSVCSSALPYTWNGLTFNAAGSQTAHLTNAAGCDSAATLTLSVGSATTSSTSLSICPSALPYSWNGLTFNAAGSQTAHITNSSGCDSAATLTLTIKANTTSSNTLSICPASLPYSWNGLTFNAAGTQTAHLTNAAGCDSAATLTLTVKANSTSSTSLSICPSALPYIWNGLTFSAAGSQTAHFTNSVGCDSAATLTLTVKANTTSSFSLSICPSALPYSWNGLTFNAAGTQTAHLTNAAGCDSAATLTLTVKANTTSNSSLSICPSALPYVWNGLTFNAAGTQTAHLTNAAGCDSAATLTLTIKANTTSSTSLSICPSALPYSWNGLTFNVAGTQTAHLPNSAGCDSAATLTLTVKANSTSSSSLSICPSALPYSWNGLTFNAAGTQTAHLTNSAGCDSAATLTLTVKANTTSSTALSICPAALPYTWNGLTFNAAGSQTAHLTNAAGCDSAATLTLTVKANTTSNTSLSICPAALPYIWNGLTFNGAGSQTAHFTNSVGCDSAATLTLTVKANTTSSTALSICPSALPYTWNGLTFNAAGSQTAHLTNAAGCDSAATLTLTVKSNTTSNTSLSICPSALPYTWNGLTFNAAGSQTAHLTNAAGCDSAATLTLTVKSNTTSNTSLSICPSALPYTWNGLTFNAAGSQTAHLTNAAGCDSAATLTLTVKSNSTSSTTLSICPSALPYTWNGLTFNAAGTQTAHFTNSVGCDSAATLTLTIKANSTSNSSLSICPSALPYIWNGLTFNTAGSQTAHFTNSVGCDSAATLTLTIKANTTSNTSLSVCPSSIPYVWNGLTFNAAGTQTAHLTNSAGCDSAATLTLSVGSNITNNISLSVCPSDMPYTWNGLTFSVAGAQTAHFTNSGGCDSAVTLTLTVKANTTSNTLLSICPSALPFSWNGLTFNAAGTQTAHLTNSAGCDSAATLTLTIKATTSSNSTLSVCPADLPYSWNGLTFNTAGTQTAHLTNAAGCDSAATLSLTVKANTTSNSTLSICPIDLPYTWNGLTFNTAGSQTAHLPNSAGCDSAATLTLTVKANTSSNASLSVCPSDLPYTWNGLTFNTAGTQTAHLTNAAGCDSAATLTLTVKANTTSNTTLSLCPADLPYSWNGLTFNAAGTQTAHLTNAAGCDSAATLTLTVKANTTSSTSLSVCPVDLPYTWNGLTFNAAGTQTAHLTNAAGCDSAATLTLTVKANTTSNASLSICPNDLPYTWNGLIFNNAGTQTAHFTNAAGCDSAATLTLTVKANTTSSTSLSVCPVDLPYTWNGLIFNAAGTQTAHLTNAAGCDSAATLTLTVKANTISNASLSICPSDLPYTWNGLTFNAAGSQTAHFTNAAGCDSAATLTLTVKTNTTSSSSLSVCPSALPYTWNGLTFNTAGTQTAHLTNTAGCDSAATLTLTVKTDFTSNTTLSICPSDLPYTWNGLTFNSAGTQTAHLTNSVGCDSAATLILTVKANTTSNNTLSICPADLPYSWNGLTFNAAGTQTAHLTNAAGCDSAATLTLTVKVNTTSNTTLSICPSDLPYTWNGLIFNNAGTQTAHLPNSAGCDSAATLTLTVKANTTSNATLSICPSDLPYTWNGLTFNAAGTQTAHLTNAAGCDSAATLTLTIKANTTSNASLSICPSDLPYTWNGLIFNNAGTQTAHLPNSSGCDSAATLTVIVKANTTSNNSISICPSALPYTWNGLTFNAAGTQTALLTNAAGCDSAATLTVIIKANTISNNNISICPSALPYTWNGLIFNAAGTQTAHLTNSAGCDSAATLTLTVKANTTSNATLSICTSDLPYTWNGLTFNTAGTQTAHLTNAAGCDSAATLTLIVKANSSSNNVLSICPSALPYTWNGLIFNAAGTQTAHLTNAAGCDSAATLTLIVKANSSSNNTLSICPSALPYIWNGLTFNTAGTQTAHFTNVAGCDSTATLTLTVKAASSSNNTVSICLSALPYTWNGLTFNAAGTQTAQLINSAGCDSAATLTVTVKSNSSSNNTVSICPSALPYTWNGLTFNAAGTQSVHFTNSVGCDSIASLTLIVKANSSSNNTLSICPSALPYTWNGLTFNAAGTQTAHLTNSAGCDSAATLTLIVKQNSSSNTTVNICPSALPYSWNGLTFNAAGTQTVHFINNAGCDSTATLTVIVKANSSSNNTLSICPSALPYTWNGLTFNAAGTQTAQLTNSAGCDSAATLTLTVKNTSSSTTTVNRCTSALPFIWNGSTYTSAGTYIKHLTNAAGCDSVATLVLTVTTQKVPVFNAVAPICKDAQLNALPVISVNGITGTWSPSIDNTKTTTYTFTPAASECATTTSLTITVIPIPEINPATVSICNGGTATIQLTSNIPATFTWAASDNPATIGETLSQQTTGIITNSITNTSNVVQTVLYNVIASSSVTDCPSGSQTVTIKVNPKVPAFAGKDTNAVIGKPLQLTATGGVSYQWNPGGLLNNSSISNPIATLSGDTRFVVKVTDNLGCVAFDTILVKAYQESTFYVPTAFSPNGDGLNDVFRPIPVGIVTFEWFRVYNRWGELVFESNEWMKGWDGIYKGEKQPEGTFVWQVKGKNINGKEIYLKGPVVLVR